MKHFVDDYIDSMDNEHDALNISKLVREVYQEGGFELRNWASNYGKVLRELADGRSSEPLPVQFGSTEKILGMYWEPSSDYLDIFSGLHA